MPQRHRQQLNVEEIGDATVIKLTQTRLDDSNIKGIEEQLLRLAGARAQPRLHLDLRSVENVSSMTLAKLVSLHKRLGAAGGQLSLGNVGPKVYRLLERTRLTNVLDVTRKDAEEKPDGGPAAPGA
jgi:anti-anti-sigma factor